jgi:hypothetical protein
MPGPDSPKLKDQPGDATGPDGKPIEAQWDGDPTAAAYAVMEQKETEQIIRGLSGQELSDFIYNIPFKTPKEKGGRVECKAEHCKYRDQDIPHLHVTGIGAGGMDEIRRIYEGVQVVILGKPERTHQKNKYVWRARAVALDCITGNMTTADAVQPETTADANRDAADPRAHFAPRIAERKAKRNAVGEILPQVFMNKIKEWALEGKRLFTAEDAERLITSLGYSRKHRQMRCMLDPTTGALVMSTTPGTPVLGSGMATGAAPLPLPPKELPPAKPPESEPEPAPEPEKPQRAKAGMATKKQQKMFFAIFKDRNVDQGEFRAFLQEKFGSTRTEDVPKDAVDMVKKWLEDWAPAEASEPPTEESPFDGMSDADAGEFLDGMEK